MNINPQSSFSGVLGQEETKKQLLSAILAKRHVLILGPPGVGKTTIAKSVSELVPDKKFVRIQGSPDLTVEDLLGDIDPIKAMKFGPTSKEAFTPGKIFKADGGVLFFDELNRAPEKLQNALLQVLQEGYATIGSYDVDFPTNFIFIATMNPEDSSTEKVSDVLLDRFDVVYMNHPQTKELETQIVKNNGQKIMDVPEEITRSIVSLIHKLRNDPRIERKPSVRATIGLYERCQTHAQIKNRSVTMKDLEAIMVSVLAHRIRLKPSVKYTLSPEKVIKQIFSEQQDSSESDSDDTP